jgi:hypothetical protein
MYGSLESIMGKALPEVKGLEMDIDEEIEELPDKAQKSAGKEESSTLF